MKALLSRRWRSAAFAGFAAPWLFPLAAWSAEPELLAASQQATVVAPVPLALTLDECRRLSLDKQPALAAQRASLASAEIQLKALDKLSALSLLRRDLPVRREQACLGVTIAAAGLEATERDTLYAVTRTYFSAIYARQQRLIADDVVKKLTDARENAARLLKAGDPRLTQTDVDKADIYIRLADLRREEAVRGETLALAALREAIGLAPGCEVTAADQNLPDTIPQVFRETVVAQALAQRAELNQAATLAEITCLEVDAQGKTLAPTARTFASASDIHARTIPPGLMDGEYRPAAVGPEMPVSLVGCRKDRVERARALSGRAYAVVDKTRNLIALEADEAFLRWQEAALQVPKTREAARLGEGMAKAELERFLSLAPVPDRDTAQRQPLDYRGVLEAVVLSSQARAAHNQALFQHALGLTSLERVTGGTFCPVFGKALPAR